MTPDDPLLQQALELAAQATSENFEETIKKAQELPLVYELVVVIRATSRDVKLVNLKVFSDWLKKHSALVNTGNSPVMLEALQKLKPYPKNP